MQPWLISVVPHGITDIGIAPIPIVTLTHIITSSCIICLNKKYRTTALIPFSIMHIRHDYNSIIINNYSKNKNKYNDWLYSVFIHSTWIYNYKIAQYYLALIHTPIHYKNTYNIINKLDKYNKYKLLLCCICIFVLSVVCYKLPQCSLDCLNNMWVSPIIAHTLISEYISKLVYNNTN